MSNQILDASESDLVYGESLAKFALERREEGVRFMFGDWLKSLDDAALSDFVELAERARFLDDLPRMRVMLLIAGIAAAEERLRPEDFAGDTLFELAQHLFVPALVESKRRQGLLFVQDPLSICAEGRISIALTPKAIDHGFNLLNVLQ